MNTVDEAFRAFPEAPNLTVAARATVMHYCSLGVMPGIDVTVQVVNFHGKAFAQEFNPYYRPLSISEGLWWGGWNIDRMVSLRAQVIRQGRGWPSIALGQRDAAGTSIYGATYVVATQRFSSPGAGLGLHLGAARRARKAPAAGRLDGIFGGIDYSPSPRLGLVLEATGQDIHLGARINVTRQLQLQPTFFGMKWLGGGASYTVQM